MGHARPLWLAASLGLAVLVACSSSGSDPGAPAPAPVTDGADAAPVMPAPEVEAGAPPLPYPAFPSNAPQIVSSGGKVLTAPKLVLFTFAGDPLAMDAQSFVAAVGKSSYWSATTKEYGVGAATALPPITLPDAPPATLDQAAIETWLAGELDGTHPEVPAPDGHTLYVIVYPEGTTVTGGTETGCVEFGGFHAEAALTPSGSTPYVVVPRCAKFNGLAGKNLLTFALSHELVEAVLNPLTRTAPAYAWVDMPHDAIALAVRGGEAGDICPFDSTQVSDLPFLVQRTWSNASAKAGHHPCVPLDPRPYFATVPVLPDLTPNAEPVPAVTILPGKSRTIDLHLSSDAPVSVDWDVSIIDMASYFGGPAELSFVLDRETGNNGDVLHLAITSLREGTIGQTKGYSLFVVHSSSKDGVFTNNAGVVQNQ